MALVGVVASLTACLGEPVIRVEVCADVHVPQEVDALHLFLRDEGGSEFDYGVFEVFTPDPADGGADCVAGTVESFPQSFDLRGGSGRMWVEVKGLRDGVEVTRVEARAEVPARGAETVIVALTGDCLGIQCAFGQTCVRGQCEITQFGGTPDACEGLEERAAPDGGVPVCEGG